MNQELDQSKILVVEDDELLREVVIRLLEQEEYVVEGARDAATALSMMEEGNYDCCLSDVVMPGMSGLELLSIVKREYPDTPFVILTGINTLENVVKAIRLGAYDFLTKPIEDPNLLYIAVARALEKRHLSLEARWYQETLENHVREKTRELAIRNRQLSGYAVQLEGMTINVIASMAVAMEAKDPYTAGHSNRVTNYSLRVGRRIGLSAEEMVVLERAALLHDLGKLIVEVSSISKPGPLSDPEWEKVLLHPEVGERMLEPFPFLQRERNHIRHHHERYDGKGYPDGISGNQIPLLTEIISVADSFDAMTSKRSYRRQADFQDACRELERSIGTQFSDRVVPAFLQLLREDDPKEKEATSFLRHVNLSPLKPFAVHLPYHETSRA